MIVRSLSKTPYLAVGALLVACTSTEFRPLFRVLVHLGGPPIGKAPDKELNWSFSLPIFFVLVQSDASRGLLYQPGE